MTLNIKVEGLDDVIKGLEKSPEMTVNEISKAIQSSLNTIRTKTIREAPIGKGKNPGLLKRSVQPYRMESRLRGKIDVTAPYAEAVHQGSRPHEIRPKTKKALAFEIGGWRGYTTSSSGKSYYGKKEGSNVVVRHVHHPGYKGNPFFSRAIEKSLAEINRFFDRAMINILNSIK
ncbi:MAG: hypothetical protein PHN89_02720 [Candidatus Pacebacteria bacterium]|nr:hypothetical protein [Candidatus Paceibacterota bacterium]